VAAIADLAGVPVYPTPLYSILTNVVIGVLLIRLWSLHASFGIIAGVYLLSNGIARFVEESYRGEPQTPVIGGLRLYQWVALLSVTAGAWLTTTSSGTAPGLSLHFDSRMLLAGALYGLLAGAAMGIDFPASSRRFARLAPP
jgi:phosphatidylglycerol:prolipoprotein diacylglycerol transferase